MKPTLAWTKIVEQISQEFVALEESFAKRGCLTAEAWKRHAAIARTIAEGPVREAREAREIAFAAYQEQAVTLLFLLDAQRTETEAAMLQSDAVSQYRKSRLELEAAVGSPLEGEAR